VIKNIIQKLYEKEIYNESKVNKIMRITGSCVQWACPTAQPDLQAHRNTRANRYTQ